MTEDSEPNICDPEEQDDTPQPKLQIVLDVYEDGSVVVTPMFNDLQANLMVLAKAQAYCAEMFVLQARLEAEGTEGGKIETIH